MRIPRNFLAAALTGATVLATNLLLTETAFAGSASDSCFNWRATGQGPIQKSPNSVTARCKTGQSGKWNDKELWLPGVLGVDDKGAFRWARNGYFDRRSKGCAVRQGASPHAGQTFSCQTKRRDGTWTTSSFLLSELRYSNGTLYPPKFK